MFLEQDISLLQHQENRESFGTRSINNRENRNGSGKKVDLTNAGNTHILERKRKKIFLQEE